jgi:hypothetical protein
MDSPSSELLVVISIIAISATFAIGAAMKSVRQSREKRVTATIQISPNGADDLSRPREQMAFDLSDLEHDKIRIITLPQGENNAVVFKKLLSSVTKYLDGSGLYTAINGRMTVKKAQRERTHLHSDRVSRSLQSGYFKYFTVKYYPLTDRVVVSKH